MIATTTLEPGVAEWQGYALGLPPSAGLAQLVLPVTSGYRHERCVASDVTKLVG